MVLIKLNELFVQTNEMNSLWTVRGGYLRYAVSPYARWKFIRTWACGWLICQCSTWGFDAMTNWSFGNSGPREESPVTTQDRWLWLMSLSCKRFRYIQQILDIFSLTSRWRSSFARFTFINSELPLVCVLYLCFAKNFIL